MVVMKENAKADTSYAVLLHLWLLSLSLFGSFVFILWDKFNWFEALVRSNVCVCVFCPCGIFFIVIHKQFNRKWYTNFIRNNTFYSSHYIQFITFYVCIIYDYGYICVVFLWVRAKISLSNLIIKFITYMCFCIWFTLGFFSSLCVKKCMTFPFKCNDTHTHSQPQQQFVDLWNLVSKFPADLAVLTWIDAIDTALHGVRIYVHCTQTHTWLLRAFRTWSVWSQKK